MRKQRHSCKGIHKQKTARSCGSSLGRVPKSGKRSSGSRVYSKNGWSRKRTNLIKSALKECSKAARALRNGNEIFAKCFLESAIQYLNI